jgi:predicted ATPase
LAFDQEGTKERTVTFDAGSISDGTLRVLGMVTALVQQPTPSLILIEEPEATIHPGAMGTIQNLIQIGAERSQVIVTTHSPELLDAKWIEERHLRVVWWENGATFVYPLGAGAVSALQQHLMSPGELFRVNALDATLQVGPAPAPLFDNALV